MLCTCRTMLASGSARCSFNHSLRAAVSCRAGMDVFVRLSFNCGCFHRGSFTFVATSVLAVPFDICFHVFGPTYSGQNSEKEMWFYQPYRVNTQRKKRHFLLPTCCTTSASGSARCSFTHRPRDHFIASCGEGCLRLVL